MEKKKRNSMYDPIYISKRDNISIEESKDRIEVMKKNKVTSLNGFIKRHGEEIGRIKFEEFKETSKHTLKKFIEKYGDDVGNEKWNEYLSKKDSTSFNWALSKTKGDHKLASELHNKRIEELSSIKFDMNYFIEKYGIEKAEEEMHRFKKNKDTSSYEWALNKAGGDYKLADEIYYKRCEDKSVTLGSASKESLILFNPLIEWLLEIGIEKCDIFCGVKNSNEICIYDKVNKKRYYYDFFIKSIGIIIEYNGEKFHPNYEKYDILHLEENWKHPYNNDLNIKDLIKKDKDKIENAISKGYDIHIVWSSDPDKLENIKKIIKKKIKYESKKNNKVWN